MSVRRMLTATSFAAGLFALGIGVASAAPETAAPAVEPNAQDALSKMGAYLRSQQAFEVHVDIVREEVDNNDQKLSSWGPRSTRRRKTRQLSLILADDRRVRHLCTTASQRPSRAPVQFLHNYRGTSDHP